MNVGTRESVAKRGIAIPSTWIVVGPQRRILLFAHFTRVSHYFYEFIMAYKDSKARRIDLSLARSARHLQASEAGRAEAASQRRA
jgi:hypothetical protein